LDHVFIVDGGLRPFWRFFLAAVLLLVAYLVAGEAMGVAYLALGRHPGPVAAFFWDALATLLAVLAAFKLLTSVFERRPLGSVGLAFHRHWWRELGHGLAVGAAMILIVAGLEWAGGLAQFTFAPQPLLRATALTFLLLLVAAINEELTFRGYPFQRLVESITPVGAIAVASALFGLVHLGNPYHTWFSTANTMLVGIPLAVAYLRTRSLWMPIGIHLIWNFLMGFLLGLPVSGLTFPVSIIAARVHGAAWLTGAEYGPEGGGLATVAIVAATFYVIFSKRIYLTEEMRALVFAPVPACAAEQPITLFAAGSTKE
jgi:hypothetical protein